MAMLLVATLVVARPRGAPASAHSAVPAREHLCNYYDPKCDARPYHDACFACCSPQICRIYKNNMSSAMETESVANGLAATGRGEARALHGATAADAVSRHIAVAVVLPLPQQKQWCLDYFLQLTNAPQVRQQRLADNGNSVMSDAQYAAAILPASIQVVRVCAAALVRTAPM